MMLKTLLAKRIICIIAMAVVPLFLIGIGIAIYFYPAKDGSLYGYSMFYNFLSALGRTKTRYGVNNYISSIIFNSGLIMVNLTMMLFWYIRVDLVTSDKKRRIALICCLSFCAGLIGVGLTPYNLHPKIHDCSVYSALVLAVPGIFILINNSHAEFSSNIYKRFWITFGIILFFVQLPFIILMQLKYLPFRPTNPILQKLNVGVFIIWFSCECILYWNYLKINRQSQTVISQKSS
jgi:hypothetical protein